jgi:hypothetical protein
MAHPSSELEDTFVNVWVNGDSNNPKDKDFYNAFVNLCAYDLIDARIRLTVLQRLLSIATPELQSWVNP